MTGLESGRLQSQLDYTRRLWAATLTWYESADKKAQVLLALDGAFLSLLTTSIFRKPDDIAPLTHQFGPTTWLFLGVMVVTLTGSILCAIACLWSRIHLGRAVRAQLAEPKVDLARHATYAPEAIWFFQLVAHLQPKEFQDHMLAMTPELEVRALADQIVALSKNVAWKHTLVNVGFALAGSSLIGFLIAGIGYFVTL